jgi:excisionase family DNA binding protein
MVMPVRRRDRRKSSGVTSTKWAVRGPLRVVPVTFRDAVQFISAHHRHHQPPQGMKYVIGVAERSELVGVATVGRPVARHLDDGVTVEVTRTCTRQVPNANSMLYGAAWRAARALGYTRMITYTQHGESGRSLQAAGLVRVAELRPRSGWHTPSRARDDHGADHIGRARWEIHSRGQPRAPTSAAEPAPTRSPSGRTSCNSAVSAGTAGDRPHPTCCRSSTWNGMGHMESTAPSTCLEQRGDAGGDAHDAVASALCELADAIREAARRTDPDPLKLLRAEQVAELLDLPARTVHDQAAAGTIPHRRFGKHYRFSRDDVDAIVRQMARDVSQTRLGSRVV